MDRYQKVEQKKQDIPISENEIRITSQGLVRNYISYATSLLQERRGKEIVLKAMGQAISKTVAIAEIIKRRTPQLHQDTAISSVSITDVWEPIEEGLVPVEMTRHVSMISITLSPKELNKTSPGYQPPNYVDRQRPLYNNYQRQYQPRQARPAYNAVNQDDFEPNGGNYEGGRDQGQGRGGGRGRGWNRGGYGNYQKGGGYGNYQRGGYGNYQGSGYENQQGDEYGNQQGRGYGNRQGAGYGNQQGDAYGNQRGRGYVNRRGGGYGNYRGGGYDNYQGDGYGNQQGDGYGNYQENNGYSNYGRGGGRGGNSGNRGTGYGRGGRSVGGGGRGYSRGRGRMGNRPRDGDQQQE